MRLVTCPSCSRHVRSSEPHCPFCGVAKRAPSGALLTVMAACLCAANCKPAAHDAAPRATSSARPISSAPAAAPSASADLGRFGLGRAAVYGAPPPPASAAAAPRGNVTLGTLAPPEGAPANTDSVVRGMIPGVRNCYNRALQTAPNLAPKLQATLRLTLRIGPGGEVESATTAVNPNVPELASAVACIKARAMAALFESTGKSSVVTADLTLALTP